MGPIGAEALDVYFLGERAPDADEVWLAYRVALRELAAEEATYRVMGRSRQIEIDRIHEAVQKDPDGVFEFTGTEASIAYRPGYGTVMTARISFRLARPIEDYDRIAICLGKLPGVLYGRLYNVEYDRWQNETRLAAYQAAGKPTAGLTLGRDEIFNKPCVDIQRNPGRYIDRGEYVETLGQYMWLPKTFWKLAGAKQESVCAALPHWVVGAFIRLRLSEQSFTESNPPSGKIRRLLFP